jgi:hypothetical protein
MGELEARPKRRLGMLPVVVPLTRRERIAAITRVLMGLDAEGTIAHVGAREVQKPLKSTVSLCASCLAYVPALVFERSGRVLMAKRCSEHGASEVLVERDARYYHLSNKDKSGKRFAKDAPFHIPTLPGFVSGALSEGGECCAPGETCGPTDGTSQLANRTCTVLVEVTDACNLACKVCYSESAKESATSPSSSSRRTCASSSRRRAASTRSRSRAASPRSTRASGSSWTSR